MRPLVSLLALLFACSTPPARPPASPALHAAPAPSPPTDPALRLSCADTLPCPSFVGMTAPLREVHDEHCTGTLVGPDLFLTAGHCLSAASREPGDTCRGHFVHFPSTAENEAEQAECERVVDIALSRGDSVLGPDYALIRLDSELTRQPARVHPQWPDEGHEVRVWGVRQTAEYSFSIRSQACRVIGPNRAAQVLGAEAEEAGWLERCTVFPGHSGAPVLDRSGALRALVHAGSDPFFALGVMSRLPRITP